MIVRRFTLLGVTIAALLAPLARGEMMHPDARMLASSRPVTLVPGLGLVARAVEGAESSYGTDRRMWQRDLHGPQGPMQVSEAAAFDVGGGDRFDPIENRELGRAYLAHMFRRYNNWEDAVIAYNWGPRNLDNWIGAGRPPEGFSALIRTYLGRVMHEAETLAEGRVLAAAAPRSPTTITGAALTPPLPEPKNLALRRAFDLNQADIKGLREFLNATNTAAGGVRPNIQTVSTAPERDPRGAVLAVIRRVAVRPGYEEFRTFPGARTVALAPVSAYRDIALVLIGKLQSECAAIILVDQRRAENR
jgi:hypothetical protein